MKTTASNTRCAFCLAAVIALCAAMPATAAEVNNDINTDTSYTTTRTTLAASSTVFYNIADGVTLTMTRTETSGQFMPQGTGAAIRNTGIVIGPTGPLETGRLIIENIKNTAGNASIYQAAANNANTLFKATNAIFRNNYASGFGGVFLLNGNATNGPTQRLELENVLLEGNSAANAAGGGVVRTNGAIIITSATFLGNFTAGRHGAIGLNNNDTPVAIIDRAHFENNRAGSYGGAIGTQAVAGGIRTGVSGTNLTFKDNWANQTGGAINYSGTAGYSFSIHMTRLGAIDSYEYTGNFAAGNIDTMAYDTVAGNLRPATASAAAGGFYYADAGASGTLALIIDDGVTLAIGDASADNRAYDSIASADDTANIVKSGSGTLVLNADNSHFKGAVAINQGRVILGNAGAQLGGAITVADGAAFGGSGSLATNGGASSLTLMDGVTMEIGAINDAAPQTLALDGDLTLNGDAVFRFDIFQDGLSDRFLVNGAVTQVSGTSTLDVNILLSGTHNLGNIGNLDWGGVTVGGAAPVAGARQSGIIDTTGSPGNLLLVVDADISRALTWNAGSGTWDITSDNWAGSNSVTKFASGDRAIFNGASDAVVTLAGNSEIWMADMRVDGAGNHTFDGEAGIVASTASVNLGDGSDPDRITDATGKLHKTGAGTLTFANGANTFTNGIEIGDTTTQGGAIVFNNTNQLGVGEGAAIHFVNTGTLSAASASVVGDLATNILIDAGRTAVLSTQGGMLTYSGALSGGATAVFAQGGATDILLLTGDSDTFEGVTNVAGVMLLSGGTLGGTVNVASGAIFGGEGAATGANSVHAAAGSTIQVGLSGGDGSEVLSIANLRLANGATITGHGILSGTAAIAAADTASMNIEDGKTIALAATLGGDGELVKTGAGTLNVTTGKLQAGTVKVQQGVLRAAGGVINVTTLNIATAGALAGAGRITVGPGGLVNAGAIKVGRAGGGASHGTLNIDGNYTGSGGTVELAFSNGSTQKDVLNINGTVGGSTDLVITAVNIVDAPSGLPSNLVTVNDGLGEVPEGAFNVVSPGVVIGSNPYPYIYNPVSGRWSSDGAPVASVPAVAGLDAATLLIGKASLGSLSQRLGALRDNISHGSAQLWMNGFYRHDKLGAGACEDATIATTGIQAGADWTRPIKDGTTRLTLGVFIDYAGADMDMDGDIASTTTKSKAIGLYARLRGSNWYADAVFRAGLLDYTVDVPGLPSFDTEANTWAASIEVGRAFRGFAGWTIEPQVQVIYQSTFMDDATDSRGFVYRANGTESVEGRAGARLWRQFTLKNNVIVTPYARASFVHEFKSDSALYVSDRVFANDLGGAAGMMDAGVSVQFTRNFSAYAGVSWLKGGKIGSYAFDLGAALAW